MSSSRSSFSRKLAAAVGSGAERELLKNVVGRRDRFLFVECDGR